MNKRGFTLIELLAVIVILAIIALIATPIVLSIINESKESSRLRSAEMYLKGIETSVATAILDEQNITDGTYPIMSDGNICLGTITDNKCKKEETLVVEMNGETPERGSITIASGKVTDLAFTYTNGKTIVKNSEGKLIYDDEKSVNESGEQKVIISPKKENYAIGDEVTIGEESFYVIADDAEKVTLLAKDCIDTTTLVQSSSADTIAFSTETYWGEGTSPYDIVETTPIPDSHLAAKAAYDYGTKVGGTGRLMTYSEAETLQTANGNILYGINGKSSSLSLCYWLGSAFANEAVWVVLSGGSGFQFVSYGSNSYFGVRPVVEISKSDIS